MKKVDVMRFVHSVGVSVVFFVFISIYNFASRGIYNLNIANKVFGHTAVLLSAGTLLIGPLSKKYKFFLKLMTIRRQLGLCAFVFLSFHIVASLLQQDRFPIPKWYQEQSVAILAGLLAAAIWLYMTYISRNSMILKIGSESWKKRLSLSGKTAIIAVLFHVIFLKINLWINWYRGLVSRQPGQTLSVPPASLLVTIFICIVVIYRILLFILNKKQK